MDCNNCNQERGDYGMGMSGRPSMQNGRNMYYGRGPRNNMRMNCGCGTNKYPMNGQVMGGQTNCRPDGCDKGNKPVDKMQIAMAYVPWQDWENVCDIDKSLEMGTIFEDLYKPYIGRPVK